MSIEKNMPNSHKICLEDRKEIKADGVKKIENFSEKEIVLITVMGKLTLKGEDLHIEKLCVDTGEFIATGKISSMVYSKASQNKGSFLEKLFK